MKNDREKKFLEKIYVQFEFLRHFVDEHKTDNDGDLYPHPLMAEFAREIIHASENNRYSFINFLEREFSKSHEDVKNLISLSFLYNLPYEGEEADWILEKIPSNLSNELKKVRS